MNTDNAARYRENWQDEVDSAFLYRTLAEVEKQPALAEVYRRFAATEEAHAHLWEEKLRQAGAPVPARRPSWRARLLGWLARRLGTQFVLPVLLTREQGDEGHYQSQAEAQAAHLPQAERSHARLLRTILGTSAGLEGGALARLEGRHRAIGGNALRAAVLGANDGLLSNLSLVMGVAGADLSAKQILITGLAGLLAGACAMALGEWLSVQSARELYQRQIAIEAQELEEFPEEEKEELILIYQAKGLKEAEARALAEELMADRRQALETLAREELRVDPDELGGSAWEAAIASFLLFASGALFPVLPFAFLEGQLAVLVSLMLSAVVLFLVGASITLLTGRSVLYTGLRQLLIGLLSASITFGLGRLLGVTLAG